MKVLSNPSNIAGTHSFYAHKHTLSEMFKNGYTYLIIIDKLVTELVSILKKNDL